MITTKRHHGLDGRYPTKPPPWKYKVIDKHNAIDTTHASTRLRLFLEPKPFRTRDSTSPTITTIYFTAQSMRSTQPILHVHRTESTNSTSPLTVPHDAFTPPRNHVNTTITKSTHPPRVATSGTHHDPTSNKHATTHTSERHPSDSKKHPIKHPSESHVIETHPQNPNIQYDRHPSDIHNITSPTTIRPDTTADTDYVHYYRLSYKIQPSSFNPPTPPSYFARNEYTQYMCHSTTYLHYPLSNTFRHINRYPPRIPPFNRKKHTPTPSPNNLSNTLQSRIPTTPTRPHHLPNMLWDRPITLDHKAIFTSQIPPKTATTEHADAAPPATTIPTTQRGTTYTTRTPTSQHIRPNTEPPFQLDRSFGPAIYKFDSVFIEIRISHRRPR